MNAASTLQIRLGGEKNVGKKKQTHTQCGRKIKMQMHLIIVYKLIESWYAFY